MVLWLQFLSCYLEPVCFQTLWKLGCVDGKFYSFWGPCSFVGISQASPFGPPGPLHTSSELFVSFWVLPSGEEEEGESLP